MRVALIQPHHEDRRSVAKRSCKRRDNTERQPDQNASVLISSVVALSCWLATSLPLLPVLSFFALFYGKSGTKFPKNFHKRSSHFIGAHDEALSVAMRANCPNRPRIIFDR